ncbi:MAG: methyltransferase, partial [Phycisphaerales bacterium]|nr:methyltransferase [Phycisphaerales bacterium]
MRYNRPSQSKRHKETPISKSSKISVLRIGGGSLSGRKLYPPPHDGTRPMTAMAKKSLFGMVAPWVADGVVLDLYCGTGTLGLESISYGAKQVYFAERDKRVIERLEKNIDLCHCADQCNLWAGNLEARIGYWLEAMETKADLVFLDPPFPAARQWNFDRMTEKLFAPLAEQLD